MAIARDRDRGERVTHPLGVYDETDELKTVLMWGRTGTEAVLAQLLPIETSCFYEHFNVPSSMTEADNAIKLLENEGVKVISVKALIADWLKDADPRPVEMNLRGLKLALEERAIDYHTEHRHKTGADLEEVMPWLEIALEADVEKYGEEGAIRLNKALSLTDELSLGNIIYARDQSNLLGRTLVWSSMRHPIRQPEVHLYKSAINASGLLARSGITQVQVAGRGRFEGGDGMMLNGICYIGVGGRTNMNGVGQVAPYLLHEGKRVIVSYDEARDKGEDEMGAMHFDTIVGAVRPDLIVACGDELERRRLIEFRIQNGRLVKKEIGGLEDHFREMGFDIVPLTKQEQEHFAPNFLNLGTGTVVLSKNEGHGLADKLEAKGIRVLDANLVNVTKGYGGLHCMTAAISRG